MAEIFERFPTKEAFDAYWNENYVPITYEDVKEQFEEYVNSVEKHIFISDYEETGNISRGTFLDHLSEDAAFMFQDILTECFYDKNADIYESAFALFEEAQMSGERDRDVSETFHKVYDQLYHEFMQILYDTFFK